MKTRYVFESRVKVWPAAKLIEEWEYLTGKRYAAEIPRETLVQEVVDALCRERKEEKTDA